KLLVLLGFQPMKAGQMRDQRACRRLHPHSSVCAPPRNQVALISNSVGNTRTGAICDPFDLFNHRHDLFRRILRKDNRMDALSFQYMDLAREREPRFCGPGQTAQQAYSRLAAGRSPRRTVTATANSSRSHLRNATIDLPVTAR